MSTRKSVLLKSAETRGSPFDWRGKPSTFVAGPANASFTPKGHAATTRLSQQHKHSGVALPGGAANLPIELRKGRL